MRVAYEVSSFRAPYIFQIKPILDRLDSFDIRRLGRDRLATNIYIFLFVDVTFVTRHVRSSLYY